jgi:hypothetical protein
MAVLYNGRTPDEAFASITSLTETQADDIISGYRLASQICDGLLHFEIRGSTSDCVIVYNKTIFGGRYSNVYTAIGAAIGTYVGRGGTGSTNTIVSLVNSNSTTAGLLWTPSSLGSKLELWFDIASLSSTSHDTEVTSWASHSASNISVTLDKNASATGPLYKTSGTTLSSPCLSFNDDHLRGLDFLSTAIDQEDPYELYIVCQVPATSSNGTLVALQGALLRLGIWANDDEVFARDNTSGNFGTASGNATNLDTPQIVGLFRNTATGSKGSVSQTVKLLSGLADGNDGIVDSVTMTSSGTQIATTADLVLGDYGTGSSRLQPLIGEIGDVMLIRGNLTDSERASLFSYWQTKFSLSTQTPAVLED